MAAGKTITLITGANGGIGFELARQLIAEESNHVLLGSRSLEKGEKAVKELESQGQPGSVELLQIDVTDEDSISAAAKSVESKHGRLDALVNNAAIAGSNGTISQQMAQCFETNATGPLLVLEAFAALLKKSTATPRVVNVSSGAGSITRLTTSTPSKQDFKFPQYRASKAALNMVTACQWVDYRDDGFKIFAFCPGFTVSNLSVMNKAESGAKPTSEGTAPIVKILKGERDDESGKFLIGDGNYPW